jgi:hypothetical protein
MAVWLKTGHVESLQEKTERRKSVKLRWEL